MSRKSRMQDLRARKDRRMKMIAVGGAVLLVAILAFEMPHYLGGSKSPAPAGTTSAAATPGPTTAAATATPPVTAAGTAAAGTAAAAAPTADAKLPSNSDQAPTRTKSQLYSFDTFAGHDPFVQQVDPNAANTPGSPASGSGSGGQITASAGSAPSQPAQQPAQQTAARTLARSGVATIEVNGKSETVSVGSSFPSANPVFKLVSLANGAAKIGIANGSYKSGAQTVTLSSGRSLTLVDTADGVRYKLRLLSAS